MAVISPLKRYARTTQASVVRCIARTLRLDYRIEPLAILAAVGIDHQLLKTIDRRIPFELCGRLWQAAADVAGDACFGLNAVRHIKAADRHGIDLLTLTSHTLGEAVLRRCEFAPLMSNVTWQRICQDGEGNWRLEFHAPAGAAATTSYAWDFMLASYIKIFEQYSGLPAEKILVDFTLAGAASGSEQGWRKLGVVPRYDQPGTALVFSGHHWYRRTTASNPHLQAHLELPLLQQLRLLGEPTPLSALRSRLALLLNDDPTLVRFAERLQLTPRQLEHDLDTHGLTFSQLLDETRHCTALKLLAEPETSLDLIACQLGLSKASSLIRALHRWEGVTPKAWRQQQNASFACR